MSKKLFLEPHYGDIAWSCAGLIALHKENSLVVNIFPPKRKYFRLQFKGFTYRKKKRVEKRFQELFGIKIIFTKFKSALMRGRSVKELFDKNLNPLEKDLVLQLREYITNLVIKEDITEIYCPMAQRNQIDHLIVREAVSGLLLTKCKKYYYEDFPNFMPKTEQLTIDPNLIEEKVDISEVLEEKIEAVLLYNSLIETYFTSEKTLIELIRKTPYEIYWLEKQ